MSEKIIPSQRKLFDIPDDIAYLNCAYMSPLLKSVSAAGEVAVRRKRHPWEISTADFFEVPDCGRELFARLIGAGSESIAVVPAVSYGIAIAALNIEMRPGDEIVLLEDQFPSNVYAWKEKARASGGRLVVIPRTPWSGEITERKTWTSRIIQAINSRTAVVALSQCHWIDGSTVDLVAVGRAARKTGAALVLDVTQTAGAMPIDVQEIQPDYLVCAAYKWLLGPYSVGFLYVAPHRLQGRPLEHGWTDRKGASDFSRLVDYQDEYAPGAVRFDMGQRSQLQLMPMAIRAMQQILAWGVPEIAATLAVKTLSIAERAGQMGLNSVPQDQRAGHYLGLEFPDGIPAKIHERLAEHKVYVSIRGNNMRVTPHLYNTEMDSNRLFEVLETLL